MSLLTELGRPEALKAINIALLTEREELRRTNESSTGQKSVILILTQALNLAINRLQKKPRLIQAFSACAGLTI
jgi:hypothetical protein